MSTAENADPQTLNRGLLSVSTVLAEIKAALVARDKEVELAIIALVARQNLLFLGPPGVAKTMTAQMIGNALGNSFFALLLSRFTEPAEVFGPVSVRKLVTEDKREWKTEGYLPTARVALLDECFKASSAILNSLLTIINEHVFDNGGRREPVPLQTLFGASNELPQEDNLMALYDRFLLRHEVVPVANPLALLDFRPQPTSQIEHLDAVQHAATKVGLPPDVRQGMLAVKQRMEAAGASVSDRRFMQSASLVRATALLSGRGVATKADLWILGHCYWQTPDQIATAHLAAKQVAGGAGGAPNTRPPPRQGSGGGVPTDPTAIWNQVQARVRGGNAQQNGTDAQLHSWIDSLLVNRFGSPAQQQQLADWKRGIASMGSWLGSTQP